jgi:hypothetical protein
MIVIQYSDTRSVYASDRLAALGSLAKTFAENAECKHADYKAGLWLPDMPRQLLWRRNIINKEMK